MRSSLAVLAHHLSAVGSTGSTPAAKGSIYGTLPLLLLFGAVAYFLFIRPSRRRAKQAQQTTTELAPGVEVLTRHGQYATVVSVDDDGIVLEVAPGVHSRFVREAIARVITPPEPEPEPEYAGDEPPAIEMIPDGEPPVVTPDPPVTFEDPAAPGTGVTDTPPPYAGTAGLDEPTGSPASPVEPGSGSGDGSPGPLRPDGDGTP